jgi:hypothetical protein
MSASDPDVGGIAGFHVLISVSPSGLYGTGQRDGTRAQCPRTSVWNGFWMRAIEEFGNFFLCSG